MIGKLGLLHEQTRMAWHGETLQVVLSGANYHFTNVLGETQGLGRAELTWVKSIFYPNLLKKEK